MKFYGFLSNSHTAALISPDASIDWLPFPRFDSPAVFCKLLGDDQNGFFHIVPEGQEGHAEQEYLHDTNVVKTVWRTDAGRAVIHDYLAIGRPELRRFVKSEIPLKVECQPRFHYGLIQATPTPIEHGAIFRNPLDREALILLIHPDDERLFDGVTAQYSMGRWVLPPGRYELILQYIADDEDRLVEAADVIREQTAVLKDDLAHEDLNAALTETILFWRHRLDMLPAYHGPYADAYRRSLLVLYGLTYQTNGAIIAAPTTSLPETIGETRQWDYRFAWVRDGSYAAEALLMAGDHVGSRRFLEFLLNCIDLQGKPFDAPFFHVDGTLIRGEHDLGWLAGYQGSYPCREGNAATRQLQLDIEGDFLYTVYRYYADTHDQEFLRFYWHRIRLAVDWVEANWHQKDASLWEFRDQDDYYTHSQLMCWVALHYGSKMADAVNDAERANRWNKAAEKIQHTIETRGFNQDENSYVQSFGGSAVDAALLVMPLYGFCAADDPRFLGTLKKIEADLVKGHWVYRYASDMLGTAAHPFVLASFWLARVYIRLGRTNEAENLIQGLLGYCTDLGLLGEHADQETGDPRGNFPQGFSHLGLIMSLIELHAARSEPKASR
ncbi:glycoside hydrolase family 15 protein [Sulfobacillus harzensis]|uniref:Glycoside hydrolase family 15 protein n=1 Tax=Sulfobacillus harzensis TaxID=2729629 RepID=A0A7Y0L427_9FIRM|nr:glycoside hydrolase family 15 protein [Sulfobacillus harzensis]NMP22932.1 glycoside hydrolase family 15 protein [Sulfobacillus harzensis]